MMTQLQKLLSLVGLYSTTPLSNRNYIVDGNFDQWINTSVSISSGANTLSAATMFIGVCGTGGAATINRAVLTGSNDPLGMTSPISNLLTFAQTTASTGSNSAILQRVESVKSLHGRSATFSCWLWCASGTVTIPGINYSQFFGTGGSPSSTVGGSFLVNWTVTTTPQKFSARIDIPSIAGTTLGTNNNDYLQIGVLFPLNQTFTVNTAQWQLEQCSPQAPAAGAPTQFEYRGQQAELARVQRYYETGSLLIQGPVAGYLAVPIPFKVTHRGAPAMSGTFGYSSANTGALVSTDGTGGYVQANMTAAGGSATVTYIADARQ
jgi:hypothetical protein